MVLPNQRLQSILFIFILTILISTSCSNASTYHPIQLQQDLQSSNTSICIAQDSEHSGQKLQGYNIKNVDLQPQSTNCSKQSPQFWMNITSKYLCDHNTSQINKTKSKDRQSTRQRDIIFFNLNMGSISILLTIFSLINLDKNGSLGNTFFNTIQYYFQRAHNHLGNCLNVFIRLYKDPFKKNLTNIPNKAVQPIYDVWTDHKQQINHDHQCIICFSNDITTRLNCRHVYHYSCILKWIVQKGHCPLCIRPITSMTLYCKGCMMKKKDIRMSKVEKQLDQLNQFCENCS